MLYPEYPYTHIVKNIYILLHKEFYPLFYFIYFNIADAVI